MVAAQLLARSIANDEGRSNRELFPLAFEAFIPAKSQGFDAGAHQKASLAFIATMPPWMPKLTWAIRSAKRGFSFSAKRKAV